jgi:cyclopropane fatty-acyl-phospholipid synthase-like methyltransferase
MTQTQTTQEKERWEFMKELLGDYRTELGDHWSYNFRNDPKRLAFVLSRYKFSAKMACKKGKVLELGCSEGIGAPILAENMEGYVGVDLDRSAIDCAKNIFPSSKFQFLFDDFLNKQYGSFDAIVSLDVVEHILPSFEDEYFMTVYQNLAPKGICVIGTPNITAAPYASKASQLGHVNLYSQDRLKSVMQRYFHYVFPFGMNDETMHTGFASMSHYIFCVGFEKRDVYAGN